MTENNASPSDLGTALRRMALVLSVLFLALAIWHPAFRAGDALSGRFVVPIAIAVGLGGIGLFGAGTATLLAVLFVAGQAVCLQLIRAGKAIGFQHWVPIADLAAWPEIGFLLFVVAQALIVGVTYRRYRRTGRLQRPPIRPGFRLLAVVAAFVLTGAVLSRQPAAYASELVLAALIQLVQLANLVLAIALIPEDRAATLREAIDRLLGTGKSREPPGLDRFVLLAAAWCTVVAGLLAVLVYQRHPHIPDEVGYLFQARYFARGMLAMPVPPVPQAFDLGLMTFEATRWYSPTPPAWPAVLAVGVLIGAPWVINPLLTGVCVILAYLFVTDLYGVRTARLATLALCVSPWFLFMGSNLHAHQWTLVWGLVAALGVARARRPGRRRWGWLIAAGLALGVLALLRPLEALAMAVMVGVWSLASAPARGWRRLLPGAVLAVVSMGLASVQLAYNRFYTGRATVFPLMEYLHARYGAGSNALGFGADRGFGWTGLDPLPGHGPVDVAINTILNAHLVNVELLGWSFGSLLVLFAFLAAGRWRREDRLMATAILGIVVAHAFYWFSGGPDFGARYWYLVLVPCLVLTIRGLETVGTAIDEDGDRSGPTRALVAGALLGISALVTFVPWRAADKYYEYRGMRPDVRTMADELGMGASLVLVRGERWPDYSSAAVYNPIDLDAPQPIYVWDRDPEVTRQVLRAYRDRDVWVLDGPSRTGDGFAVVSGPVPAERMLETLDPGT